MPRGVRHLHGSQQLLPPHAGRLGWGRLWTGRGGGHASHGVWPLHGPTHLRCTVWHHQVFFSNGIMLIYNLLTWQCRLCSADHSGSGWPLGGRQVHKCLWPSSPVPGCRYTYWSSYCWWAILKMTFKTLKVQLFNRSFVWSLPEL